MRHTRHGPYLRRLTRLGLVNVYLVGEKDGLTLVDTGIGGSAPGILKAARTLGQPIRRIVLTHAHVDHTGSLGALHAALPDVPVLLSSREVRLLRDERQLDPDEPLSPLRGGWRPSTVPVRPLHQGDRVRSLEVVAAPGHTPGQIALLDTRDGTLIAGDAYHTVGGVTVVSERRPIFPFPALATWHAPTALASARRLADLNPARLAPGHGRVVENPVPAMRGAVARLEN
ncbi:MBL fold metallo-hydrolase [Deinococcus planocerae]|uniref:MBL fold metallo-hydrolase n=1 Tax=Deinococcus planocerae TaxID=1737569 RepID=UPI000C7F58C4|nr:MBL fold metallo-hydrolase [Deinococcus planocerae]